ncbi:hypothetical protein [Acuticoccus yangtzensis]|uniref:hypothetical protein n=1 Tax=Acuticoccus yangtzensis TaxID=1443441 RepID=UPI0009497752|nr:hypothetical protein [Acuticoccus yangtzensis]
MTMSDSRPTAEPSGNAISDAEAERRRRQRKRSVAIALVLVALVALFYAITILQMTANSPGAAS